MLGWLLRAFGLVAVVGLLTLVTQVGGAVFVAACTTTWIFRKRLKSTVGRYAALLGTFLLFYAFLASVVLPKAARAYGRVPLPLVGSVRPLTWWTFILNRHYVTPAVKTALYEVSDEMKKEFPGTKINYLDAGFPLFKTFPLWPHRSHNDGRKLDLAFFYTDASGKPVTDTPSPVGYGVFEGPRRGEEDFPASCRKKGYWQYGVLEKLVPQGRKNDLLFDAQRTAALVRLLSKHAVTEKIFIEPHLRQRLKLSSGKVRYHGCQAVRHDDHVHWQVQAGRM